MTVAPIGKFGGVDIALGTNGVMLLAIFTVQLFGVVRWLLGLIFNTAKKKEQERDKAIEELVVSMRQLTSDVNVMKLTMLKEEQVIKTIHYEMLKADRDRRP